MGELSGFSEEEELDRNSCGGRTAEEKLKRSLFGDDEGNNLLCYQYVFDMVCLQKLLILLVHHSVAPLEDIAEEEEQPEEEEEGDIIGEEDEMADFIVDEEDVDETGAVVRSDMLSLVGLSVCSLVAFIIF